MNRTKIEWTDYTWNPIVGCKNGCPYCYARRFAERFYGSFEPRFFPERLDEPKRVKKPSKIFCCSMGEPFGDWIPRSWTASILYTMRNAYWHTFQILTKCPENLLGKHSFVFPKNVWIGTTVDTRSAIHRIQYLRDVKARVKFISFEPLLEYIPQLDLLRALRAFQTDNYINWVIIGAKTGPKPFIPPRRWVEEIISAARYSGCAVFLKDNLRWPELIREFPNGGNEV